MHTYVRSIYTHTYYIDKQVKTQTLPKTENTLKSGFKDIYFIFVLFCQNLCYSEISHFLSGSRIEIAIKSKIQESN